MANEVNGGVFYSCVFDQTLAEQLFNDKGLLL